MKKAWKGILGLLMAMTFTVSAGRMVYAETVDENHEVPDGRHYRLFKSAL